jgi:uncharacterized membrane protein YqgA involved in biofilm formation
METKIIITFLIALLIGAVIGYVLRPIECNVNDLDVKNCISKANDYNQRYLQIINNRLNCEPAFEDPVNYTLSWNNGS